jgi:hypothetical protein
LSELILAPLLAGACFSTAATTAVLYRRRTVEGHITDANESHDEDALGTNPAEVLEL